MAIDRGPWNALIDDDGSNLTGSIWNKNAIKTVLLDPIDALYPRVDVAYSAGFYGSEAGVWTVEAADQLAFSYAIIGGKLVTVTIFLYDTNQSAPTAGLRIYYTFGTAGKDVGGPFTYASPGGNGTGYVQATNGTNYLRCMRDFVGTPWPAGSTSIIMSFSFWLQ